MDDAAFPFCSRCGDYSVHTGLLSAVAVVDVGEATSYNLVCASSTILALSVENSLSLCEVGPAELADPLIEVDFDHELVSLAWDLSESCLVVGDSGGSVHLLTASGLIVFSKKIIAGEAFTATRFLPQISYLTSSSTLDLRSLSSSDLSPAVYSSR